MDSDTAEALADLCNADLATIRIEIEKLATYAGAGQPIRRADVDALVVSEKKYSVFELADMLATGQRAKALAFLDSLLREGEQPPALVGAMAWMFRTLLAVKELGPGTSAGQAAGRLRLRMHTAEIAVRQAPKISQRQLADGLRALYDADSHLKSGADDRAVMEFLVAQLMDPKPAPAAAKAQQGSPVPRK
jgi:DNA polymerase III subunit delta